MPKPLKLVLSTEVAFQDDLFRAEAAKAAGATTSDAVYIRMLKRSIDARSRHVKVLIEAEAYINEPLPALLNYDFRYEDVSKKEPVIIIGFGPAGIFAALRLIELGLKPIVFERGADVQSRRRDLAAINKKHIVNPESNYCFGEGGAGAYSDGKLYTRSNKRGDVRRILEIMVKHGAAEEILFDAHPHIGTNKLPKLVATLRERITGCGGEVHFNTAVDDILIKDNAADGVKLRSGESVFGRAVILATGHSARDIYFMLDRKQILIEAKPFAMGVRAEHSQYLINSIQYHGAKGEYLPPAAYSLVCQTLLNKKQRGVFSFCMCPGGFIVPSATAPGEVAVNGMSPSKRDNKFANSGIVVAIDKEDINAFGNGALAGLRMQMQLEKNACVWGGGTQSAPAQLLADFAKSNFKSRVLDSSYVPGLTAAPLHELLPKSMSARLQYALKAFGEKMKGYLTNEAQLIGVESRTSSPVRIPRDPESFQHPQIANLFPCGEGAGYAGGIVSAAMDGERAAEKTLLII